MIKGTLKTMQDFLSEGATFDEYGSLIQKDKNIIDYGDFCLLGKSFEDISYDKDDNLFIIASDNGLTSFFRKSDFSYLEESKEKKDKGIDCDFNTDGLKAFWDKEGTNEVKFFFVEDELLLKDLSDKYVDVSDHF